MTDWDLILRLAAPAVTAALAIMALWWLVNAFFGEKVLKISLEAHSVDMVQVDANWRTNPGSNNANAVLKDVMKNHVQIDKEERRKMVEVITTFVKDRLMDHLKKKQPIFKILFREIYFSGSYYDGLRVGNAKEFDLNVVFNVPVPSEYLHIQDMDVNPGFIQVAILKEMSSILQQNHPLKEYETKFTDILLEKEWSGNKYYFYTSKMRCWMESILTKTVAEFGMVKLRKSGPAITLEIQTSLGQVDVDLVPVLCFKFTELRNHPRSYNRVRDIAGVTGEFFAVPKNPKGVLENCDKYWRLSFPQQESSLIHGRQCVKPIIKLLKTLRDRNQEFYTLSSYSLQNVVMQMLVNRTDIYLWSSESNMAVLFIYALETLLQYLTDQHIPHIFDEECNLLWDTHSDTIFNMKNRLAKILGDMKQSKDNMNCRQVWLKFI